jgi:hypothetical protein
MAEDLRPSRSPARRRPSRRAITLVSIPLICLVIMSYVGDALAPTLIDTHPVLLMALNSRTRNLVLVTNEVDALTFYSVGLIRLLVSDPLFFLLGMWYGDAAVQWMERGSRTFGDAFERPIDDLVGWIGDHRIPLLVLSITLVLVSIALEARKGETEVSSLAHLDDELEELDDELDDDELDTGRQAEREPEEPPEDAD